MELIKEKLFNGVYDGLTVMLTGHTGFKGSWMALWLNHLGANVVGYSLETHGPDSHFLVTRPQITSLYGDIRDKEKLQQAFATHKPDLLIHMAAQPLVRASYRDPSFTYETNVIGTLNVLEVARHCGSVKAIVNITTDKVYENLEVDRGYSETDRFGGYDPYSSSKACAEILTSSYRNSFLQDGSLLLASVRAGNVIGGGDWSEDRLIPDIIRAARDGSVTEIRSPRATRPWQHVLDPLSGYLMLGQKLLEGEATFAEGWNFGPYPDANLPVGEIIARMEQHWDQVKYEINEAEAKKFHEAKLLYLDISKAEQKLGWTPTWGIERSIEMTVNWYRHYVETGLPRSQEDLFAFLEDARVAQKAWV